MLHLEIIEKRASDLLSMWLGETEKLVRAAFEEAEGRKAVLLFDEADSLISDRANAVRSWERTQTNEFLTCLERYSGIFVATTNALTELYPASLRRFAWKIEFRALLPEAKVELFRKYFPAVSLSEQQTVELREITPLTPGDYKAVQLCLAYRDPDSLKAPEILQSLRNESSYKPENRTKRVGFRD